MPFGTAQPINNPTGGCMMYDTDEITDNATWPSWNTQITFSSAATNAAIYIPATWGAWNLQGTFSVTTGTVITVNNNVTTPATNVWPFWVAASGITIQNQAFRAPAPTPEQMRASRKQIAEHRLARMRAKKLLIQHLNEEQRKQYKQHGHFKLRTVGKDGSLRCYRIDKGTSRNIRLVEERAGQADRVIRTYCAHPDNNMIGVLPDEDAMLAQKFMLETAEDEFLRVANVS